MNIDGNILLEFNAFIQKSAMMLPQSNAPVPGAPQPPAPAAGDAGGDATNINYGTPMSGQAIPRNPPMPAVNNSIGSISNTNTAAPAGAPQKAKAIKKE